MILVISTVHIVSCLFLILLVLLQQGKGADVGATLGGDSSSLFGPMSENPLKNLTTIVAVVFMTTSVSQAYIIKNTPASTGERLFDSVKDTKSTEVVNEASKAVPTVPVETNKVESITTESAVPETNTAAPAETK